jgi:hypothetical protein
MPGMTRSYHRSRWRYLTRSMSYQAMCFLPNRCLHQSWKMAVKPAFRQRACCWMTMLSSLRRALGFRNRCHKSQIARTCSRVLPRVWYCCSWKRHWNACEHCWVENYSYCGDVARSHLQKYLLVASVLDGTLCPSTCREHMVPDPHTRSTYDSGETVLSAYLFVTPDL